MLIRAKSSQSNLLSSSPSKHFSIAAVIFMVVLRGWVRQAWSAAAWGTSTDCRAMLGLKWIGKCHDLHVLVEIVVKHRRKGCGCPNC